MNRKQLYLLAVLGTVGCDRLVGQSQTTTADTTHGVEAISRDSMIVDTLDRDKMTGKARYVVTWRATANGHLGKFNPSLGFRCVDNHLDALLLTPGNPSQNARTFLGDAIEGMAVLHVKADTVADIHKWDGNIVQDGVFLRFADRLARLVLTAQDTFLVQYSTIWDEKLTLEFGLGPLPQRTTALKAVFSACGKSLAGE